MKANRRLWTGVALMVVVTACSSDSDGFQTALLAGGGEPGTESHIPGAVSVLTPGLDGSLSALSDGNTLVDIAHDGTVTTSELQLPDGVNELAELAVAPDATTYAIGDESSPQATASIYRVDGTNLVPAFGVPSEADGYGPDGSSPDGTPATEATLGPINDIAVDGTGRIVFSEIHSPDGGVINAVQTVRRIESDGTLKTLAGTPDGTTDDGTGWFPDDGTSAAGHALAWPVFVAAGPDDQVYARTGRSILSIDGGELRHLFGGNTSGLQPAFDAGQAEPFADARDGRDVQYEEIDRTTFAVNTDGAALVGQQVAPRNLDADTRDSFAWQLGESDDNAQAHADDAIDPEREASGGSTATLYISPDHTVATASVIGDVSTWIDDDTIATALVSNRADRESIVVTYDGRAEHTHG